MASDGGKFPLPRRKGELTFAPASLGAEPYPKEDDGEECSDRDREMGCTVPGSLCVGESEEVDIATITRQ